MKKKSLIQLIVLVVVLAAMIAGYFVMKNYNKQHPQKSTSATEAKMSETEAETVDVTSFATDDVTGVTVQYNGQTTNLQKLNNKWQNTDKNTAEIDTDKVTSFLTSFTKIKAAEKIADAKDLSKYGLDKPAAVVTITTYNKTIKISLGNYNSMIQKYYLELGTEPTVYTVSSDVFDACKKTAADFEKTAANATAATGTAAAESAFSAQDTAAASTESETVSASVDSNATLKLPAEASTAAAASQSAAK